MVNAVPGPVEVPGALVIGGRFRLRFPVVFVCRHPERWPELFDGSVWPPTLDAVHERVVTHEDLTIVQSAVMLAGAGYDVRLAAEPDPAALNVVSGIDLRIADRTANVFVIAFRGDWARPQLADLTLTMNGSVATRSRETAMPHWIQTGLVERDRTREPRIRSLVFKGDLVNLAEAFRSDAVLDELRRRDIGFAAHVFDHTTRTSGWHDYRDVDAVIAVRDIAAVELATKPASKLINAWAAGVPALLGVEPAYRELRVGPLDYIEVSEPGEMLAAIDRLNADPQLYLAMVQHGRIRALAYRRERMVERWVQYLNGPAAAAFDAWSREPRWKRSVRFGVRAVRQRSENLVFARMQSTR
ncbi:MAG: glycosyltransferase family 1 protein [Actinobacteria bacterium]|nr:glycosyltransferase family 1 protein [Actinomycetota bacterium]